MADANRTLVNNFVNHHGVTPLWEDKSKAWIAKWFSDNGFARAYSSNANNWSGLINPFDGSRSYAQAAAVGQRVDERTPDATAQERADGYRIFWIIQDPWGQITWGAGNWPMNCSCINIEHLGDYRNYALRDGDVRVTANFWRPRDQELKGATTVYGHLEVSDAATACPSRIMESRDKIVEYINNPPKPAPVITNKTIVEETIIPFARKTTEDSTTSETKVTTKGANGVRTITYSVTYTDGKETKRVIASNILTPPIDEVTVIGTYVAPPEEPPIVKPPVEEKESWLDRLLKLIKELIELLKRK